MSLIGADDLEMDAALMDAGAVGKKPGSLDGRFSGQWQGKNDGHIGSW